MRNTLPVHIKTVATVFEIHKTTIIEPNDNISRKVH